MGLLGAFTNLLKGLVNLYSMVNYCIDMQTCKRVLIAQHFNDDLWDKSGKCNAMCDHCLNKQKQGNTTIVRVNCMTEVRQICDLIERNEEKDKKEKRVTANKLTELVYSELNSRKNKSSTHNSLSKLELESLILTMLMKKYLKEDFHFTPYNTICYVVNGPKSGRLDYETDFPMMLERAVAMGAKLMKDSSQNINISREIPVPKIPESIKYELVDDDDDDEKDNSDDDDDCQLIFDQDDEVLPKRVRCPSVEEEDDSSTSGGVCKKSKLELN